MENKGYQVIREVSRGPITTVYLATQTSLQRPVLIKKLNPQWETSSDIARRFRREALICAKLRHPNIVTMFDVVSEETSIFLVMEYVDGRNLEQLIKAGHPVPAEKILTITTAIIDGLSYAHQHGVLHRDIKPANIMIPDEGPPKISDFGLARMADMPGLTAEGATVGTPAYMSPEQAMGRPVDAKSDLFSLGATIYHLASGESPFAAESIPASIQNVLEKEPAPLHELRSDLPEDFCTGIMQLLSKEAGQRPELTFFSDNLKAHETAAGNSLPVRNSKRTSFSRVLWIVPILITIAGLWWFSGSNTHVQQTPSAVLEVPVSKDSLTDHPERIATDSLEPLPIIPPTVIGDSETVLENYSERKRPDLSPVEDETPMQVSDSSEKTTDGIAVSQLSMLTILCTPWAEIRLDDVVMDTTPTAHPLALEAGTYQLALHNPEFESHVRAIRLTPGKHDTVSVTLQPKFGYLVLRISPWAHIYIDDQKMGTSPLSEPLRLPPGLHQLRLENNSFPNHEEEIDIPAGGTVEREIFLRR